MGQPAREDANVCRTLRQVRAAVLCALSFVTGGGAHAAAFARTESALARKSLSVGRLVMRLWN
jgi:hypothetical protein